MNLNVAESIAAASKLTPGMLGMAIVAALLAFTMWQGGKSQAQVAMELSNVNENLVRLTDKIEEYEEHARESVRIAAVTCTHVANGSTEARFACLGGRPGD